MATLRSASHAIVTAPSSPKRSRNAEAAKGIDTKILFLYAKGQSTHDIVDSITELYDVGISPTLISRVTDRITESVIEWQNRTLDPLHPILYLDCPVLKIRQNQRVINKSLYPALGVYVDGHKELLGMWLAETEGAKVWLSVLTELRTRGLEDILIACGDGLKGLPRRLRLSIRSAGPALHRAHGAQQFETGVVQGLQGCDSGPEG